MSNKQDGVTGIGQRRASAKVDAGPAYQARRDEIIKAAGQVFLAKGFGSTSFKDIAETIGVDRASLYYYFSSKHDLFQTATESAVARNTEAAEQLAASDATPADKVARILDMVLDSYTNTDYPYMFIFLQEDVARLTVAAGSKERADRWAKEVSALSRRYEAAVTRIFDDGVKAGAFHTSVPPHILTKALVGMANWTQRWYRVDGNYSPEDISRMFTQLILDGVRH